MTDRELLELAAKAAEFKFFGFDAKGNLCIDPVDYTPWNPLKDDGDALRLAVKLGLAIRVLEKCVFVESGPETLLGQSLVSELEMHAGDPYKATRRAIVRAAAAIGKDMK